MSQQRNYLQQDLEALRYLDALTAGDWETVAACWEEASCNPELEKTLAEVDRGFLVERGASPALEPLPSRRLGGPFLANAPVRKRRLVMAVGVVAGAAACCIIALLLWGQRSRDSNRDLTKTENTRVAASSVIDDTDSIGAWRDRERVLEEPTATAFSWPLEPAKPVGAFASIPADLLD
jgi:hypothetical protein